MVWLRLVHIVAGVVWVGSAVFAALFALTAFETFDLLAGPTRTPAAVAPIVLRIARAVLAEPLV